MSLHALFFFFFFFLSLFTRRAMSLHHCTPTDSGPLVPTHPAVSFLERVQVAAFETFGSEGYDPKLYLDMSLKFDLSITEEAFEKLPRTANGSVPSQDLTLFLDKYLNGAGEDLICVEPKDFVAEPEGFLPKVENPKVRAWAFEVHSLWKNLSRKVSDRVMELPDLHTLLPLPNPVIIPGSRFREVYYWDSYWIIRGLLASKMYETAKGMLVNLISLLDKFGYVLNGARAYYTNRSQPPLLSAMVSDVYIRTGDMELVKKALPALLKEHEFWNSGIHKVTIKDIQGFSHTLNRYYAMWNKPRPECSIIDKETASKVLDACQKTKLYREIASAAETGWDFSTRWMRNASDLTTLATTSIIPVDLNVFILKMELDIAFLANVTGESDISLRFTEASRERKKAINSIFWNAEMGQWLDYWLSDDPYQWDSRNQNRNIFASNFIPLWIGQFSSEGTTMLKAIESLQSSGLLYAAGIATSLINSGQQWDFPNGWAPLQHLIIEGLANSESKKARTMAQEIVESWIRTNYVAYKKSGVMHEKYNVEKCGEFGGGGEYSPQHQNK